MVWRFCRQIGSAVFVLLVPMTQTAEAICPAELEQQIEAITQQPAFRQSYWGILIQTLSDDPQTLYAQNPEKLFIPASNAKLLTTAAALTQLGSTFRIRTSIYQMPSSDGQVSLRIVGRGDPSFSAAQLQDLTQQIQAQGITQIEHLIADDQYFQDDWVNPTWDWEDIQAGYGAPVNSLMLNQNAINLMLIPQELGQPLEVEWENPTEAIGWQILNRSRTVTVESAEFVRVGRDLSRPLLRVEGQLRVGSASEPVAVSIPQPTQHFLEQFRQSLVAAGISVNQTEIATDRVALPAEEIAAIESANLSELLVETNQHSNNLYAESLLRQMGRGVSNNAFTSLAAGIDVLEATLAQLGIDPRHYHLEDGSGLSRQNLVSPTALTVVLQAMARSPDAESYRASLSVAGISGTLRHRFRGTPVAERFYGKTGALSNTAALSGYLQTLDGDTLVLSILVNHTELPLSEVQAAIDAIVALSSQLHEPNCQSGNPDRTARNCYYNCDPRLP